MSELVFQGIRVTAPNSALTKQVLQSPVRSKPRQSYQSTHQNGGNVGYLPSNPNSSNARASVVYPLAMFQYQIIIRFTPIVNVVF